ncbi:tRNA (adenosine(37)-N6)-threonylcarbamoyltransferase complex dimerization subunit type 1 TsaB [uncultured Sphingomonas sp.]|uniref:tRNA (adenosine(37)-N6)-threonylcarbamoyltransferase complex dimerization subunit type 1 TsaB n=1 Tax=uncultured Sphingomonas sp. TaxID=158754 RepID=UPI0025F18F1A|nr:tRNA (adenosine(37)-N6)-threonylcarbamoyltransferase complex dimerization subunit type 1 TsaB [uncultured Sphingomonas sp.]
MGLTLVIDTATAACSVALIDGDHVIASAHQIVGRGHAERLVPMIAELPGGGRAEAILVDCGPGSFTGVRVGIAAAVGLGIGWGVPVSGYSSTALIAAAGLADNIDWEGLAVVLEGGHGELFVQPYDRPLAPAGPLASLKPDAALAAIGDRPAIGTGVRWLGDADGVEALPDAARAILLPQALRTLPPRPIYGRAPDAKPQAPK